jgi:antitoxin component YwqK of YwqJK toxin-antitoxin module
MRLPLLIALACAAGLTVSVRVIQSAHASTAQQTQETYYANGQVEMQCETKEGKREGACRRYYPDGSKQAEGRYVDGKMEGPWTFWLEDGSVDAARSGSYAAGGRESP